MISIAQSTGDISADIYRQKSAKPIETPQLAGLEKHHQKLMAQAQAEQNPFTNGSSYGASTSAKTVPDGEGVFDHCVARRTCNCWTKTRRTSHARCCLSASTDLAGSTPHQAYEVLCRQIFHHCLTAHVPWTIAAVCQEHSRCDSMKGKMNDCRRTTGTATWHQQKSFQQLHI